MAKSLLKKGNIVTGIDNLNDYYDVQLKHNRLEQLKEFNNFQFVQADIADENKVNMLFTKNKFDILLNLAA